MLHKYIYTHTSYLNYVYIYISYALIICVYNIWIICIYIYTYICIYIYCLLLIQPLHAIIVYPTTPSDSIRKLNKFSCLMFPPWSPSFGSVLRTVLVVRGKVQVVVPEFEAVAKVRIDLADCAGSPALDPEIWSWASMYVNWTLTEQLLCM